MKSNQSQKNIHVEWEYKELGELLDYEQPINYIVTLENYKDGYKIPVLTAGKTFILGYTNENFGIYKDLPVIIFDDFTTAHKFVDFPFKVKSSAMKILRAKDKVNLKFIYGWIQIHPYVVGEHKRNYLSEYQYQDILLPPPLEQNRIVMVLEIWDKVIEKIAKKIEIKKQIKKGLVQSLLTGEKRLNGFNDKWEIVALGDICKIKTGGKDVNEGNPLGAYPFFTCAKNYTYSDNYSFDTEAILIAGNGEIGNCQFYSGKFEAYQRTYVLTDINKNIQYIFAYLDCFFRDAINSQKQMGAMPFIKMGMLKKYEIKIPKSEKEQNAIANIIIVADKEILELEKKLSLIKDQKNYLLNNLITGTIRTPETLKIN